MDALERLIGVCRANEVVGYYALWNMMSYLTQVLGLKLTVAAAIINIWTASSKILQIFMAFLADAFLGYFLVLLFSNIAFSFGVCLVLYTTPQVYFHFNKNTSNGICNENKPDCICDTQKTLFFVALGLISIGLSGTNTAILSMEVQQRKVEKKIPVMAEGCFSMTVGRSRFVYYAIIAIFALFDLSWVVTFGLSAVCSVATTLFFLEGWFSYKTDAKKGSPLTTIFRVISASLSKMNYQQNTLDGGELYQGLHPRVEPTNRLRVLNKAAIDLPYQYLSRWRLCTVYEVEETKASIIMVPIFIYVLAGGLVSSLGNTFFLEQATHLNPYIFKWKVPVQFLLVLYSFFSFPEAYRNDDEATMPVGGSFYLAAFYCIIAAFLEFVRLSQVGSYNQDERAVPSMSMFWLIPQYLYLGWHDSIFKQSLSCFIKIRAPSTLGCYRKEFVEGILGVGVGLTTLFVHGVGKLSRAKGNPNWFQETIDQSRLDYYLWSLVSLSIVLLIMSCCCCSCYGINHKGRSYDGDDSAGFTRWMNEQRIKKLNAEKEVRPVDEYYAAKFRKGELTFREKYELHQHYWHCLTEDERKELKNSIEPVEDLKDNSGVSEPLLQ